MSSVREQILQAVEAKLEAVRAALAWTTCARNPRDWIDESEMNALVMVDGGEPDPDGLTGHVEEREVEFSVGLLVIETSGGDRAEALIDAGYVAVTDALLDPADIQLGGIAIAVRQRAVGDPLYGRAEGGARWMGGLSMDFAVRYLAMEGDASRSAP